MGTHLARHQSQIDISRKGAAYGIPASAVDGMDVLAVERAARKAVEFVRRERSPYLLEARTYRFRAHSMYDPELYRSKTEVEQWKTRDPIARFTGWLKAEGLIRDDELASLEQSIAREIDEAVAFAEAGAWEPVEDLTKDVYTP
jgi:TPP-dependent pyruvate/acetoin dehydrogenase alpha subunit